MKRARKDTVGRVAVAVAAATAVAVSLYGLLVAAYFAVLTCDEVCERGVGSWRGNRDAWQWSAQFGLAIAAACAAVWALLGCMCGRRGWPALAASIVLWGGWFWLVWG